MTQINAYRSIFIFIFLVFMGCSHLATYSMGNEDNHSCVGLQTPVQRRKDKMRLRNQMYLQIDTWKHTALQTLRLLIQNKTTDKAYKRFLTFLNKKELSDADRKDLSALLAAKNYHTKQIGDGMPMPIWVAVAYGNIEVVKILLEKTQADDIGVNDVFGVTDFLKFTPLMLACGMGLSEMVTQLLRHNHTNINYSHQGISALNYALEYAIHTNDITCLKLLVAHDRHSIDINSDYAYVLLQAVAGGCKDIVKILLEEAGKKDRDNLSVILNTPLPPLTEEKQKGMPNFDLMGDKDLPPPILVAIVNNAPDMLELLLKHGANPSVAIHGRMPISHLMAMVYTKVLSEGTKSTATMIKLLVDYHHNHHPTYKGMDSKQRESLQDLLSIQSVGSYSILYEAVYQCNFDLIEIIQNKSCSQDSTAADYVSHGWYKVWVRGRVPTLLSTCIMKYYNETDKKRKSLLAFCVHSIIKAMDVAQVYASYMDMLPTDFVFNSMAYDYAQYMDDLYAFTYEAQNMNHLRAFDATECMDDLCGLACQGFQDMTNLVAFTYNYIQSVDVLLKHILDRYVRDCAHNRSNPSNSNGNKYKYRDKGYAILASIVSPTSKYPCHTGKFNSILSLKLEGRTFLSYVAEHGCTDLFDAMSSHDDFKAHIDLCSKDTCTPLAYAVRNQHFQLVKLLVDNGADIHAVDNSKKSILSYAISNLDVATDFHKNVRVGCIVQYLLKKNGISTAIEKLNQSQYNQLLQFVLSRSANTIAELFPILGLSTRLMHLLEEETNQEESRKLNKVITNSPNARASLQAIQTLAKQHTTPLLIAIEKENIEWVKTLLPHQSYDPKAATSWLKFLAAVCKNHNREILRLLFHSITEQHPNEHTRIISDLLNTPLFGKDSKPALFYAIGCSKPSTNHEPDPFIATLIEYGAKLNHRLPKSTELTPLLYALERKANLSIVKSLITKQSLQDVDSSRSGVLWYAVHKDYLESIPTIIEKLQEFSIELVECCQLLSNLDESKTDRLVYAALKKYFDSMVANQFYELEKVIDVNDDPGVFIRIEGKLIDGKTLWCTHHADLRKQKRHIIDAQMYDLVQNYVTKNREAWNVAQRNEADVIRLVGCMQDCTYPLCVLVSVKASSIYVVTTFWQGLPEFQGEGDAEGSNARRHRIYKKKWTRSHC